MPARWLSSRIRWLGPAGDSQAPIQYQGSDPDIGGPLPDHPPDLLAVPRGLMASTPELRVWRAPQAFAGSTLYFSHPCLFSSSVIASLLIFHSNTVRFLSVGRMPHFHPQISSMHDSLHSVLWTRLLDETKDPGEETGSRLHRAISQGFFQKAYARLNFYDQPLCRQGVLLLSCDFPI